VRTPNPFKTAIYEQFARIGKAIAGDPQVFLVTWMKASSPRKRQQER